MSQLIAFPFQMKFIDRNTHGFLDYVVFLMIILSPWLLSYFYGGIETWFPIVLGVLIIVTSVLTDFDLGIFKIIPMKYHLIIDVTLGSFLALSPWLLGFSQLVYFPHLIFGIIEIALAIITDPKTILNRDIAH